MRRCREAIDRDGETVVDRFKQVKGHPLLAAERDARAAFLAGMRMLNLDIAGDFEMSKPRRPRNRQPQLPDAISGYLMAYRSTTRRRTDWRLHKEYGFARSISPRPTNAGERSAGASCAAPSVRLRTRPSLRCIGNGGASDEPLGVCKTFSLERPHRCHGIMESFFRCLISVFKSAPAKSKAPVGSP